MAFLQIETEFAETVAPYSQRTVLDGVPYRLGFSFNARLGVWMFSIGTDAGVNLIDSLPIYNGRPLTLEHKATEGFPQGDFVAMAKERPGDPAQQDELGARVVLLYIPAG